MPRGNRVDYPGAWHHVYNRGTARRTIIENDRDGRMFLACVAWQVHARLIEVHAYALMHTHFHLLVRSPDAGLPVAMRRIQDGYARWFNRMRRRDGPLFRGRYGSRVIESDGHWFSVVPYIHDNPVSAGLAARAEEYPFSSAGPYVHGVGPPWLTREVVAREFSLKGSEGPTAPPSPGQRWLVGRWLHGRRGGLLEDPLDEVAGQPPERVRQWMERKARLADGTEPGWVMVVPSTVREVLEERRRSGDPACPGVDGGPPLDGSDLEAGILRAFTGLSHDEVAGHMGIPLSKVRRGIHRYGAAFRASKEFRDSMSRLLHECLRKDHPLRRSRWGERMAVGWATPEPVDRQTGRPSFPAGEPG